MCLLAILWRVVDDAPLIVAANREEAYARGGSPPQLVGLGGPGDRVPFIAGLDPQAGGTWLGVNAHGLLVAVTNRARTQIPAQPRSRGLLAKDLLQYRCTRDAVAAAVKELDQRRYAGCNLLIADSASAEVIHHGDWLRVNPLPPGVHALTTADLNNQVDERVAFTLSFLLGRICSTGGEWLAELKGLCGRRADPPICLNGERGGTVSSSLIALRRPLRKSTYLHAQGPPDRTPYEDFSPLFQQLS